MPNFTAGTSFTDGVTNDVTAAKLNALVADAVPTSSLSLNSTTGTISLFSSGTGTAATPAIQPAGDTNTGIFFPAADTIAFSEGGAEAMRIDSSGNVGVGTASPAGKLHVNGQTYIQGTVSGGLANSTLIANSSGQAQIWALGPNASTVGSMTFVVGRSDLSNSNQAITIDSSGNVGIGTTNPATALETANFGKGLAIGSTSDSANNITIVSSPTSTIAALKFGDGGSGVYDQGYLVYDHTNNSMLMGTNRAERLRIDSSGNVIIGTSTQWGVGKTTIESSDLALGLRAGSDNTALVIGKATNNSTTSQVLLQFLHNNYSNGIGQINANGANAAAFGSYSDSRLKENITELPSQLANICLLKPSEFDYKDGSGHQVGFIAQEIQQIYPDAVGEGDGGMLTVTGWSKTEARLVKAIQELKSENDTLKSRIEALEAA